jgi:CshA-type fibril repeat protein
MVMPVVPDTTNSAPVAQPDTAITPENQPVFGNVLTNDSDADGDTLSVTQFVINGSTYAAGATASIAGVGSLTINADGGYSFTPAPNFTGPVPQASYTVTDGQATDTSSLFIGVTPVDTPPVAQNDSRSTTANHAVSGNVLTNDSDADGDSLNVTQFVVNGATYTAGNSASIAGVGVLTINADGSYTFTPATNYTGSVPAATYTISDGNGGTASASLNISVSGSSCNTAPVANNDSATTTANHAVSGNVLTNDTDKNGDALSVTSFVVNGHSYAAGSTATITGVGTLTISASGSYTFTPAMNYSGSVPAATYTISDGHGGTDTANLNISVTGTTCNTPPVANNDSATTTENHAVSGNVLANDTDKNGDTLSVTSFVVNGHSYAAGSTASIVGVGTLAISANGSYTFTPATNYSGSVPAATYTISDGHGGTASANLSISVTLVNTPPVAQDDSTSTTANHAVFGNVLANDTDANGDTLSVTSFVVNGHNYTAGSIATLAGVGTLVVKADGSYTFTPAANYTGAAPVATYTVSDGHGGTDTATLSITVSGSSCGTNHAPTANNDCVTTTENQSVFGNVLSNDTDGDGNALSVTSFVINGHSYAAGSSATLAGIGVLIVKADGSYTFTPAANYSGSVPVATYTVSDGHGGSDSATLAFSITPVNTPPVAQDDHTSTAKNTSVSGNVLSNDTDADGNTLSVTSFVVNGHTYSAGTTATLSGIGTLVIGSNGSYTFKPATGYTGAVPVASYTVSDGHGNTDTANLSVLVGQANHAPVAANDSATTVTNLGVSGNVLANDIDVDGNSLSVTSFVINGHSYTAGCAACITGVGTLTISVNGNYSFTPAANYTGAAPLATYTVSDGHGGSATATLSINVTPANAAPVAQDDSTSTIAGHAVSGNVLANDSDANGNTLSVTSFVINGHSYAAGTSAVLAGVGTLNIGATGAYVFTPVAGYTGPVPVATYQVADGHGGADTATLSITVTPSNVAPVAQDDSASTIAGHAVSGNVLANDSDANGDTLSVTSFVINGHSYAAGTSAVLSGIGTLNIGATGAYAFTPVAGYTGSVPVATYQVADGHGGTDTATLNIAVTPSNVAPVAQDDSASTTAGHAVSGNVLSNDTDANGDHLSVSGYAINGHSYAADSTANLSGVGSLTIHADGSYSFTPVSGYDGSVPVATYQVSDGHGGSDTATLSINVTSSNVAPVAQDDHASTTLGHALAGNVLSNDTDANGDHLSVTGYVVNGHSYAADATATLSGVGSLAIHADGSYTFTPASGYTGNVPVATYQISDSHGGSDTATLSINVTGSACSGSSSWTGSGSCDSGSGSSCGNSSDSHNDSGTGGSSCGSTYDSHSGSTSGSSCDTGSNTGSCGSDSGSSSWSAFCNTASDSSFNWPSSQTSCSSGSQCSSGSTPSLGDVLSQHDSLDSLLGCASGSTSGWSGADTQSSCGSLGTYGALANLADQHQAVAHSC